jgi:hypothetical protein
MMIRPLMKGQVNREGAALMALEMTSHRWY